MAAVHVPSTPVDDDDTPPAVVDVESSLVSENLSGASSSMKWMYTYVPPATRMTMATAPVMMSLIGRVMWSSACRLGQVVHAHAADGGGREVRCHPRRDGG